MWFDVIGNSLAFIRSVLLSADLLKTREQVQDEGATYFDGNPYTTKSGLESRPMYACAFFLIVTGFAITLGGNIGEAAELSLFNSILISLLTSLGGYLVIALLYLINRRKHQTAKAKLKVKIFYSSLESLMKRYEKVIGQHNEKALFTAYKPGGIKSLKDRLNDMTTQPEQHMRDIVTELERKRTATTLKCCIEDYLREHKLK
jgi:hypothetical protein